MRRCRRGGTRRFCRRVVVMNRSGPLPTGSMLNRLARFCAAAALLMEARSWAVGTNVMNCSLKELLPAAALVPAVAKAP
jgi:hypothetical protein